MQEKKLLFQDVENRTVFVADNLDVMRKMEDEVVDLLYLDPPFGNMQTWEMKNTEKLDKLKIFFKDEQKKGFFTKVDFDAVFKNVKFDDVWKETDVNKSWQADLIDYDEKLFSFIDNIDFAAGKKGGKYYLFYMAIRLLEMKRILKKTGTLYLHCDNTMGHYLKGVLDLIFGYSNFRNEIVWCYSGGGGGKKDFARKHDTIFRYSKSNQYFFHPLYRPYSPKSQKLVNSRGGVSIDGKKRDLKRGAGMTDWWQQINSLQTMERERTGYKTQKPLVLLKRIIEASSKEGDIVLDPFCGCATTCVVAEALKRKWIGIDKNPAAFYIVYYRIRTKESIGHNKKILQTSFIPSVETSYEEEEKRKIIDILPKSFKSPRETLPVLSDLEKEEMQNEKVEADRVLDQEYKEYLEAQENILKGTEKKQFREELKSVQHNRCKICKAKIFDSYHLDRISTKAEGGEYVKENLQVLCMNCYLSKGKKTNMELVEKLFTEKKIDVDIFEINLHRECREGRISEAEKENLLKKIYHLIKEKTYV